MRAPTVHRAVDLVAMWLEDRVTRAPQPYRPAPGGPLGCFGDLPPLPLPPPPGTERWSAPSPLAGAPPGDRMLVRIHEAVPPRRGTAIVVPPWKGGEPGVASRYAGIARAAGLDAWVLTLPHHLERASPGARSGEGFVSNDLRLLRETMERLTVEIRILLALAATRGPAGVLGLSLGALGAALAATAPGPLSFAALVAPPTDLAAVLAGTRIGRRYRGLADRAGAPLPADEALREQLACFSPAARAPSTDRLFLAAGTEDAIVPPQGPIALARAWRVEPRLYRRGHVTLLFACRALRRDLASFLAAGS